MKILGKIIATISLLSVFPTLVLASNDFSRIGATVKISVCGNNIVEANEDCEKGLGIQYDCRNFGYAPKLINCDISCAYDILSCKNIEEIKEENTESKLPKLMIVWDSNNDGKLAFEELTSFLVKWVDNWKSFVILPSENSERETVAQECDINSDKTCNVTDFSIILYYLSND